MQYHIQTTPIWDAFNSDCDCPMCALYARTEERLIKRYLDDAVMEPSARVKVNKRGFCADHLKKLFVGGNKLGLSLQVNTRTEHIMDEMSEIKNASQAKNLGKKLLKTLDTCIICDEADEIMTRYAYTVAEMFLHEPEFPKTFAKSKGFCLPHFILLLDYVGRAGKEQQNYAQALYKVQIEGMRKTCSELERFSRRFDYNSNDKQSTGNDALLDAINRLKGNILSQK